MPILIKKQKNNKKKYLPYINYKLDGKPYKKYGIICDTEKEAKLILKKLQYEHEFEKKLEEVDDKSTPKKIETNANKGISWDDAFTIYRNYKVSQNIGFSQLDHIDTRFRKYIQPFFKEKTLESTTKKDIIEFQSFLLNVDQANYSNNRKGPLSPTTINKIMEVTKAIFVNTCNIEDIDLKSPFITKPVKEEEFKSGYYTKDEFKRFTRVIKEPMYEILFNLLFYTGLRIGEATALTFEDVIGQNRCIFIDKTRKRASRHDGCNTIGKPKTDSSVRNVYITEELEKMIIEYREVLIKTEPTFSDKWYIFGKEKPIGFQTIRRHNLKYAKAAGLPVIRIHDFRGSFTTNMFEHTTNIKLVSNALGHSNLATTTKHYLKAKETDKRDLFERAAA